MSDALPRNITLIGRLKKEWSRISRDIYSESYTSRQEIVPLDESTQAGVKEKPPLPGALISIGAAYRIRTYDVLIRSQTLYPAEVTPQRVIHNATAPRSRQEKILLKSKKLLAARIQATEKQVDGSRLPKYFSPPPCCCPTFKNGTLVALCTTLLGPKALPKMPPTDSLVSRKGP